MSRMRGLSVLDTQEHLAELLGGFEIAMRVRCLAQREHAVDDGSSLPSPSSGIITSRSCLVALFEPMIASSLWKM